MSSIAALAADSWLLRVLSTFAGTELDLSLGSDASLGGEDGWRGNAAWIREAIEHASDRNWWAGQEVPQGGLPRRHWLLAAFCFAGTAVTVDLIPALDSAVEALSQGEFEALQIAVGRFSKQPRARRLSLNDVLRRQAIPAMGGRTAALLTCRSDSAANAYLGRMVVERLLPLTLEASGLAPTTVIWNSVNSLKGGIELEDLRGSRSLFPFGSLRHLPTRPIALQLARDVLQNPEEWPSEVVVIAARRVAVKRSGNLRAVAEVATSDNWFR